MFTGNDSGRGLDETENRAPDKQATAMNRRDAFREPGARRLLGEKADADPLVAMANRLIDALEVRTLLHATD
jgi:hypothetical protein